MSRSGRTKMRDGAGVDLLWERRWIRRQRAVAPHPSGGHAVRRLRGGRGRREGSYVDTDTDTDWGPVCWARNLIVICNMVANGVDWTRTHGSGHENFCDDGFCCLWWWIALCGERHRR
ncbi:mucin-2-like [Iris pallida]|uniref:Mucin-2-like n=1 Tax=Iris pallida TaxID=29817 RepID=A0AAX6H4K7_IRIPA|nr:mucin-2-like [Iris pallida]